MFAEVIKVDPSKRICGKLYRKEQSALFDVFKMSVRRWSIWTMSYLGRREKVNKGGDTSSIRSPLDARWNVLSRGTL